MENQTNFDLELYTPLRDIVFNRLRDDIISGKYLVEDRLLEIDLAKKLGVSRTPVREALRNLEHEGLVKIVPRRGAQVTGLSEQELHDVLDIRAVLESLSAELACTNIKADEISELEVIKDNFAQSVHENSFEKMRAYDEEFHAYIFKASRNKKLEEILNNLKTQIYRYRVAYLKDKKSLESIIQEHDELFHHIKSKNKELAAQSAYSQIKRQEVNLIEISKKKPI